LIGGPVFLFMDSVQRRQVAEAFTRTINLSADRVLEVSDQIQDRANARPDLTVLCKFDRSMQVRRLKNISPRNWNPSDWNNASAILDQIAALKTSTRQVENILALAVLGVESDGLKDALKFLSEAYAEPELVEIAAPVAAPKPTLPERQSGKGNNSNGRRN